MSKIFLILATIIVIIIVIWSGEYIFELVYPFPKITYGVTFSPKFAQDLKLDWQQTFVQMLDGLKVKNIRLSAYWDVLEANKDKDDFSSVDFLIKEAAKRGAKVILVLGVRQPRWPECHIPAWAKGLSIRQKQVKTLEFIKKVVHRYRLDEVTKDNPIVAWQVENEPLLAVFGEGCDPYDKAFLRSEVELVRSLDKRPIIVSDSGELGFWATPMRLSDTFGTTLYRVVYNFILGYTHYPLLPYLYNLKSTIIHWVFAPQNSKTIIIELQSEPWSPTNDLAHIEVDKQTKLFSVEDFKNYINFAKKTGFDTDYLWGVEWWYWMRDHGHPEYLEYAKTLFR